MKPHIIERALELAAECSSVSEVKRRLKAEGYVQIDEHLSGRLTRQQIIARLIPSDKPRRVR
jgi:Mn-dependent DtxR family transcriptional regulator